MYVPATTRTNKLMPASVENRLTMPAVDEASPSVSSLSGTSAGGSASVGRAGASGGAAATVVPELEAPTVTGSARTTASPADKRRLCHSVAPRPTRPPSQTVAVATWTKSATNDSQRGSEVVLWPQKANDAATVRLP